LYLPSDIYFLISSGAGFEFKNKNGVADSIRLKSEKKGSSEKYFNYNNNSELLNNNEKLENEF